MSDLQIGCPSTPSSVEEEDAEGGNADEEESADASTLSKKEADRTINYLLSVCNFNQFHSGIYGQNPDAWMAAAERSKVARLAESLMEDTRKTLVIVNRRQGIEPWNITFGEPGPA